MAITGDIIVSGKVKFVPTVGDTHEVAFTRTVATDKRFAEWDVQLAASSTVTVWNPGALAVPFSAFSYLRISGDVAFEIEFACKNADAQAELSHFVIPAGGWIEIHSNASRYTYTTDAFAGTLDVYDKIRVKEVNGVNAELHVIMAAT